MLRQQLFQPQRWKASQCAFLTHVITWQKARGEREGRGGEEKDGREGGSGGEDRSFMISPVCVCACT